ncbi:MAG: winged helix-turn-helix domain-containing protein [Myxococcota bacterium]
MRRVSRQHARSARPESGVFKTSNHVVNIGEFQFHLGSSELRHAASRVPLEPRVAQLLCYLLCNAGRVVSRDELLASVWPRGEGSDAALNYAVRRVRQAFGERGHSAITTCRGQGYRFAAELTHDPDGWEPFEPDGLVERKAALDHLRAQLESCRARKESALAMVTGMAGSGKTAVVQSFRRELEARGERVLVTTWSDLPIRAELERLAGRRSLLVFIEDVHEAGSDALESLRSAVVHGVRPIFFVATCRTPLSPARSERLSELLRGARTLALDPLSDSGARRLLRAACGRRLSAVLEQRLIHLGGGNPLFLRELATTQADISKLEAQELLVQPSALSEALGRHLSELPAATLELLRCACLIGESFDARLLLREPQRRVHEIVADLEPAIAQQIVQPLSQLEFRFMHPLVHAFLRKQLTYLQRRERHWAIGMAIERLENVERERKLPNLVFHLSEGAVCQEQTAKAARVDRWVAEHDAHPTRIQTGGHAE